MNQSDEGPITVFNANTGEFRVVEQLKPTLERIANALEMIAIKLPIPDNLSPRDDAILELVDEAMIKHWEANAGREL